MQKSIGKKNARNGETAKGELQYSDGTLVLQSVCVVLHFHYLTLHKLNYETVKMFYFLLILFFLNHMEGKFPVTQSICTFYIF